MRLPQNPCAISLVLLVVCLAASRPCRCVQGREVGVEEAIELLNGEDGIAAGNAARILGNCEEADQRVITALVEHLDDERDAKVFPPLVAASPPTVGDYAAGALRQIGKPAVVAPLCKFLADTDSQTARIRALQTLNVLGRTASSSGTSSPNLYPAVSASNYPPGGRPRYVSIGQ
jgi:HEAT repeat protein